MNLKPFASAMLCLSLAACAPAGMDGESPSSSSGTVAERYVDPACQVGGCSAEICGEAGGEPIASNCMFDPSYACYATARCEQQANGECGWTMTSELSACLYDPPEIDRSSISA